MDRRKIIAIATIVICCAAVFIANLFIPLGMIVWIFFIIPLLIAYYNFSDKVLFPLVIIISVLIIINLFLTTTYVPFHYAVFNRSTGIGMFFLLAFFMREQKRAKIKIENFNSCLEQKLKESENRYKMILEITSEGVWIYNTDNIIIFVNDKLCRMLHYERHEMIGKNIIDFIDARDLNEHIKTFDDRKKGKMLSYERRLKRKDGKEVWVIGSGNPYLEDEDFHGSFSMFIDITDKKELEVLVNKHIIELERSNKELEQFAYVASHDLQEPLRMVSSYTQLLAQRYKDKLDNDANEFINYAVDGATRMQELINDLLTYSRITSKGNSFKQIEMAKVMEQILSYMKETLHEKNAIITYDKLPVINADETQILQLFQNLLVNGVKFCNKNPQVHISAKESDNDWLFSVKDNGIGIEDEYKDRIFQLFQRLHTRLEYPGTGIGLAVCKRIVERHNGKIWVESEIGKGSTFYFTIKK